MMQQRDKEGMKMVLNIFMYRILHKIFIIVAYTTCRLWYGCVSNELK